MANNNLKRLIDAFKGLVNGDSQKSLARGNQASQSIVEGVKFGPSPIDWNVHKTQKNFYVEPNFSISDSDVIIEDLKKANFSNIVDNIMWNLALCLSYGSEALAIATAKVVINSCENFSDPIGRYAWYANTMLNTGHLPSGFDFEKGIAGLHVLINNLPDNRKSFLENLIIEHTKFDIHYKYNPKDDESKKIKFVKEYSQKGRTGAIATYKILNGPTKKAAYDYLIKHKVTQKMYFLVIETPQGNFCRDINGIYKE